MHGHWNITFLKNSRWTKEICQLHEMAVLITAEKNPKYQQDRKKEILSSRSESNPVSFISTFRTLVTVLTELYSTTIQIIKIVLLKENLKQIQLYRVCFINV